MWNVERGTRNPNPDLSRGTRLFRCIRALIRVREFRVPPSALPNPHSAFRTPPSAFPIPDNAREFPFTNARPNAILFIRCDKQRWSFAKLRKPPLFGRF